VLATDEAVAAFNTERSFKGCALFRAGS